MDVLPLHDLDEPEVEKLDRSVRRHHNVVGLDVAMHDPDRMCRGQRTRRLNGKVERLAHGATSRLQFLAQRSALDEIHQQDRLARPIGKPMDSHDVRMSKLLGGSHLAQETACRLVLLECVLAQTLTGGDLARSDVNGFVDLTHAAAADLFGDAVVPHASSHELSRSLASFRRTVFERRGRLEKTLGERREK